MRKPYPADISQEMSQVIGDTEQHAKAWLGVLQYIVYSKPTRIVSGKKTDGDGKITSHFRESWIPWFEQTQDKVDAALKRAKDALANEWNKQRDPRYGSEEDCLQFAHAFEDNVAFIAGTLLDAQKQIQQGGLTQNKQARETFALLRRDLVRMVKIYTDHDIEMTNAERDNTLLKIRSRIIDGESRAL